MYPNLSANISNKQLLKLNKINEIKYYFLAEIRERELIIKNLSKYIASFEYFSKPLIFLSVVVSTIFLSVVVSHLQEYLEQVVVLHFQLHHDLRKSS